VGFPLLSALRIHQTLLSSLYQSVSSKTILTHFHTLYSA
jgi:hypothetical protein